MPSLWWEESLRLPGRLCLSVPAVQSNFESRLAGCIKAKYVEGTQLLTGNPRQLSHGLYCKWSVTFCLLFHGMVNVVHAQLSLSASASAQKATRRWVEVTQLQKLDTGTDGHLLLASMQTVSRQAD